MLKGRKKQSRWTLVDQSFMSLFITFSLIELTNIGSGIIDGLVVSNFFDPDSLAAVGIYRLKSKKTSGAFLTVNNIPMMNPDIVTGVSLMMMFVFIGGALGVTGDKVNFFTLLIAHITFNIPYVLLNVLPKLRSTDPALMEAAMDLGCTPTQAFFKAVMPQLTPAIVSGALMAFTLSFDDFVISNFTSGPDFVTLPVLIYSRVRKHFKLDVYAMYSLIFVIILALLIVYNVIQSKSEKQFEKVKK